MSLFTQEDRDYMVLASKEVGESERATVAAVFLGMAEALEAYPGKNFTPEELREMAKLFLGLTA